MSRDQPERVPYAKSKPIRMSGAAEAAQRKPPNSSVYVSSSFGFRPTYVSLCLGLCRFMAICVRLVTPKRACRLRLLKQKRVLDYLLMEQELANRMFKDGTIQDEQKVKQTQNWYHRFILSSWNILTYRHQTRWHHLGTSEPNCIILNRGWHLTIYSFSLSIALKQNPEPIKWNKFRKNKTRWNDFAGHLWLCALWRTCSLIISSLQSQGEAVENSWWFCGYNIKIMNFCEEKQFVFAHFSITKNIKIII